LIIHALPTDPTSASVSTADYCAGSTGTATLSASGGSGEKLTWYSASCGSGTAIGNGTPLSVSVPSTTTNYFARWESASCPASNCVQTTITVHPLPTPAITGGTSICQDSLQNFSTPSTGNGFSWTFTTAGSGTITSGQSTNAITLNTGSAGGTLSVTETSTFSCAQTVSVTVTLQTPSGAMAVAGQDKNVCTSTVPLNANQSAGTWTVLSGSGTFSPDATTYNAVVSGLSNGLNEFEWTVNGRCGYTSSDQVAIRVVSSNLSLALYTDIDTMCFGTQKNIQVVPAGSGSGDYTYIWTSSDNSFNQTYTSPNATVTPVSVSTIYYLTIQDNINTGCTASGQVTVYAVPNQELVIPNLITPNGDDHNDVLEIRDTNEMEILPGASLEILNRWGDRVYENSSYKNTWNAPNLSDGVYYYRLESGCGSKVYKGWLQVMR
jgi:gliding motility-associated-like protein